MKWGEFRSELHGTTPIIGMRILYWFMVFIIVAGFVAGIYGAIKGFPGNS